MTSYPKKEVTPPNSKDSEMMVLGCMLTSIHALDVASDILSADDFFYNEHKPIFGVLKDAHNTDQAVDVHLVAEELKRREQLLAVGGVGYLTTLAQYAGTSAHIEEYAAIVHDKALLRRMIHAAQNIEKIALDQPDDVSSFLEEAGNTFKAISSSSQTALPIVSATNRVQSLQQKWKLYRGQTYLGLCLDTLPVFNDKMLGLREMILLAAPPNVGKTALIVQMIVDALKRNPEACAVIISLEMSEESIMNRIICHLAKIPYNTLLLGSQKQNRSDDPNAYFTRPEINSIEYACKTVSELGDRLQIIESETTPSLNSSCVINHINQIKEKTGCSRVFVAIDYLQVWPLQLSMRGMNELEADKWRIGEVKKIRDAFKGDPVIVISESRKPGSSKEQWGGDMSDVMGSARGVYSPDAVWLLQEVTEETLAKILTPKGIENSDPYKKAAKETIEKTQRENFCLRYLKMPKGRDGMERFGILLRFDYQKNSFSEYKRM